MQKKQEQVKKVRMREKPMLWLPFLYSQVSHQPNNGITQPITKPSHYPPPSHPQRPSLNQPQSLSTPQPMLNTTFSMNQNTNQKGILQQKSCRIHPKFWCHMLNMLSYLLDNSMVAITPARFPQPPFFRGYDLNATCAYHGGALGHSIEHCMTLKHKVQSLNDVGWLKFEENRLLNPNTNERHHTWANFGSCC